MGKKKKMRKEAMVRILAILNEEGLEAAEDAAVEATELGLKIIKEVLPIYSRSLGKLAVNLIEMFEDEVFEFLDEIDGEDDPNLG